MLSTCPLLATSFGNRGLPFSDKNVFHLNLNLLAQCFVLCHGVRNDTFLMYKVIVEVGLDVFVATFVPSVVGYEV